MDYKAGSLVHVRNRDWVVLPSTDDNLVLLKPLGGSEEEITGIFLPLEFEDDGIQSTEFPQPSVEDLKDLSSARVLYNAVRLAFRNGAGPFRSLAKLSFRPRAYQMVPLIMSLRQNGPIRLLIADDVGIGKTIESLLILKELLERREIQRFAIIVLPHLCEQWQQELKDKFGIEAVIIRSNTQARLDREIHGDISVYQFYPYQIISIDYIKSDQRREVFISECPELVIVDEAHSCTKPSFADTSQQQRHQLIKDISAKKDQNLILLTATPHSGKPEQFNSLLSLLNPKYLNLNLAQADQKDRRELARYYVQRRRGDIEKSYAGEDTPFPERDPGEYSYDLSDAYMNFYDKMCKFAFGITQTDEGHAGRQRLRYWTALSLLRGVMSSPAAGVKMLKNRMQKVGDGEPLPEEDATTSVHPLLEEDSRPQDYLDTHIVSETPWTSNEVKRLNQLANELTDLFGIKKDLKIGTTYRIIQEWLTQKFNPVIFCRYIETAKYVGEVLQEEFNNSDSSVNIQVVTSEDPDEIRKSRIKDMAGSTKKILIATDCLSEGINLQDQFTAVLHYDLPWNPNRLEQREGRIDRYGQKAPVVKAFLLWSQSNPIDSVVLKVLLKKVREIRKSIGISIPFPEDSQSLMDAVLHEVITGPQQPDPRQRSFNFDNYDQVKEKELIATRAISDAAEREKATRSIFAQHAVKAEEIEEDLKQADEAIGTPKAVESFVTESLTSLLNVQISPSKEDYILYTTNLPPILKNLLPLKNELKVSFRSPTPEGHIYLGRNHIFVEQLCQFLLSQSIQHDRYGPGRAAVIRCKEVSKETTILLFRVRNVIEAKRDGTQVVAEEMLTWGFEQSQHQRETIPSDRLTHLLHHAVPAGNIDTSIKHDILIKKINYLDQIKDLLHKVALERSKVLIEAHERFHKVMGGSRYKVAEPVLPMDLMGIYILLPATSEEVVS